MNKIAPGEKENLIQEAFEEELGRRLAVLDQSDDSTFGDFGLADFIVSILLFIVLPIFFVWIFR